LTPWSGRPRAAAKTLGEHHSGEDAADQPGAGGDRHRVDRAEPDAGGGQRRGGDDVEPLGMGAGGDLGDDAAVGIVQRGLAGDLAGEDGADRGAGAAADQRDRGVVAARFDAEDQALAGHGAPPVARDGARR